MPSREKWLKRELRMLLRPDAFEDEGIEYARQSLAAVLTALNDGVARLPVRTRHGIWYVDFNAQRHPLHAEARRELDGALWLASSQNLAPPREQWPRIPLPECPPEVSKVLGARGQTPPGVGAVAGLLAYREQVQALTAPAELLHQAWALAHAAGPAVNCFMRCSNESCSRWYVARDDRVQYCRTACYPS